MLCLQIDSKNKKNERKERKEKKRESHRMEIENKITDMNTFDYLLSLFLMPFSSF